MILLRNIITTFSIFSIIPMPKSEWNESNMRWTLALFPLVGIAVGGAVFFWIKLSISLSLNDILTAATMTILPVFLTGAIHLDGFCDTADAISSHATKDKKLEILKDPNIGAFGAVYLCCYFLLYFALCTELPKDDSTLLLFALVFVAERILSGLMTITIPSAKNDGMVKTFQTSGDSKVTKVCLYLSLIVISALMLDIDAIRGAVLLVALILCLLAVAGMAKRSFGGVTGDISGFLLQCSELTALIVLVVFKLMI